jgi:hypothetical protein
MKEIKFDGVSLDEQLPGKIVGSGECSISKLSTRGMLLETISKLKINGHYRFEIKHHDTKAVLSAHVLSILLKGNIEKDNRLITLYQVAVEFENLKSDEETFLDLTIDQVLEQKVPSLDHEIRDAKFHIED